MRGLGTELISARLLCYHHLGTSNCTLLLTRITYTYIYICGHGIADKYAYIWDMYTQKTCINYVQLIPTTSETYDTCWWFRNPANQLRLVGYPHYLQGFRNIPGGCLGFLNHQQYGQKLGGATSNSLEQLHHLLARPWRPPPLRESHLGVLKARKGTTNKKQGQFS